MKQYEHSIVFDSMKNVREGIATNYTSLQYLQTLDYFLSEALRPIAAECPSLFYNYLAKVVARQTLKASAKLTSNNRHKLPVQLFNCLNAQTPEESFNQAKKMHINRGILFGFIGFFLKKLKFYVELQQFIHPYSKVERRMLLTQIEHSIGLRHGGLLYPALKQVKHWDNKARWWKSLIVQKYTRMAILQAQKTYKDFNHYVSLSDVVQIYLMVTNCAIDRCDARLGVLTTFIQSWFKSARGEVARLAESQQDSSYESLTEDHGDAIHDILGVSDPDHSADLWHDVSYVAKTVDPVGLVRTSLRIPQHVSLGHRKILEMFVYDPQQLLERSTHE